MKTCNKCGVEKPLTDYHQRAEAKDGYRNSCKLCYNSSTSEYYRSNSVKGYAQRKEYRIKNKAEVTSYQRGYREEKAPEIREQSREYRHKNRDHLASAKSVYATRNKEKINARARNWRKLHPYACRVYSQTRRARKNGGKLSPNLIPTLMLSQEGKCPCCGEPLGTDFHLDHRMPLALGGLNVDSNMQLLRAVCNRQKSSKHPVDFMRSRGHLDYQLPS